MLFCSLLLQAHVVQEIPAKVRSNGERLEMNILMDVTSGDENPDPYAPQPQRDFLYTLNEQQHQELRQKLRAFVEKTLSFVDEKGGELKYEISFPDYDSITPEFPKMISNGAYVTVRLQAPLAQSGKTRLKNINRKSPYWWINTNPEDETATDFLYLYPEEECELPFVRKVATKKFEPAKVAAQSEPKAAETKSDSSLWGYFLYFTGDGFAHVIPAGWDHILFIMALCLFSLKWKPLIHQSLLFTLAHSITLGLGVAGYLPQMPQIIEPIIALSIAWLAVENLFLKKLSKWRIATIFLFGLVHGMGFASVLGDKIQASGHFGLALFASNLGVELAQICVIAAMLLLFCKIKNDGLSDKLRRVLSMLIAVIGLGVFIQRLL